MNRPPYHWKLSTFLDFKTWQSRTLSSYKMILKDTSIPMLITTLFTIAKTWKQPKCPLTEEWIKKLWSIYTMDSYSAITKNEIMPFAAIYMDLEIVTEKAMATHSSTLAWKIPQTEELGRLQSMGSWRVRHDWVTSLSRVGEANGNPLHCSCLENPRDRGAWWAAVYGVAQSWTWLKWLSSSSSSRNCHAEWSKSDTGGKILYDTTYMWNLKRNDTNELTYKRETVSQKMNF